MMKDNKFEKSTSAILSLTNPQSSMDQIGPMFSRSEYTNLEETYQVSNDEAQ